MRRTDRRTDSNSTPSISHTLALAGPTKYPRVIRQNCWPQGVKYLNASSATRRTTAPITQAMATHRSESVNAVDQSIDGLNGFGSNFDFSFERGIREASWWTLLREGTRAIMDRLPG